MKQQHPPRLCSSEYPQIGGSLFCGPRTLSLVNFTKPSICVAGQIQLLRERGMLIADESVAQFFLTQICYHRPRGYWIPLEDYPPCHGDHMFVPGTTFEDALNLYMFDRELRLLVMDTIERIETSVRNQWADVLAESHGSRTHLEQALFKDISLHQKSVNELRAEFYRSKELYARHYRDQYKTQELPPLWVIFGLMTLGQFSHWLENLKKASDRKNISKVHGVGETQITSFMLYLTFIRNICAHYSRIWCRDLTVLIELPRKTADELYHEFVGWSDNGRVSRKVCYDLLMLVYLMNVMILWYHWEYRLKCILDQRGIDSKQVGFPDDFCERPIWRDTWSD